MSRPRLQTVEDAAEARPEPPPRAARWAFYAVAAGAVAAAALVTFALYTLAGVKWGSVPFAFFFAAVIVSARYGGRGPALLSILLSAAVADYFFIAPYAALSLDRSDILQICAFALVSLFITRLTVRAAQAEAEAERNSQSLSATLLGIGDGVVATDARGRVTLMNAAAESLTGWTLEEARGRELSEVFRVFDEETREAVESPAAKVLREGRFVGLTNHTTLVSKSGAEIPIDDSGAPVHDREGRLAGVVMVFRDVTQRRRTEALLEESEQRYRAMADAMPQIVWTARADGYFDYYNRRWFEYTGLTLEQTGGWGWQPVLHPEDVEHCLRRWATAVSTGEEYVIEYRFRRASDGQYRWHLGRAVPARDAAGRIVKWFGTATDIHDQKLAAEREHFLSEAGAILAASLDYQQTLDRLARLGVEALSDYCIIDAVGEDGGVRRVATSHVDPAAEDLVGRLRDYPPDMTKAVGVPQVLRTGRAEVANGVTDEQLTPFVRDEGHREVLSRLGVRSFMMVPLIARERAVGAVTFTSATAARRYDAEDLAFAQEFAGRAALAIDNAALYSRAREANRVKDEFLATLSHELRTPLTPILGWTHMLQSDLLSDKETTHGVEIIEQNARALTRLINDLLDMSSILSGKMSMERAPLDLAEAVGEAVEAVRTQAGGRGIILDAAGVSGPAPVSGDRARLVQLVSNLLTNAVKFSARGGTVRVSCDVRGDEAFVEVSDEGMGIEADFLPYVFERFRQADGSTTRAHGGLGIGLALVKSFAEAHDGSVSAESEGPDRGSRFTVRLPLLPAARGVRRAEEEGDVAGARTADDDAQPSKPKAHVLIVEDSTDTLDMLRVAFAARGYRTILCDSAAEALRVAPSIACDIIVSDIGLPQIDGYELIGRLRELPHLRDVPAVALTGYAAAKDVEAALSAGFQRHIPKPVDPSLLTAAVAELLGDELKGGGPVE
jgi:PAS domain S-box-containing protein